MASTSESRSSITDVLYNKRHTAIPWICMTGFGILLSSLPLCLMIVLLEYETVMRIIQSPIWTVFLAITASPLAYYVWLVRDRNTLEARRQTKEAELIKTFHQLQEWITETENEPRRINAIQQLEDFIRPDSYLFPAEMTYFKDFQERARDYFRLLLANRHIYDSQFEPEAPGKQYVFNDLLTQSTAVTTVAEILKRHIQTLTPLYNLQAQRMDLSGTDFSNTSIHGARFIRTNLQNASFAKAKLTNIRIEKSIVSNPILTEAEMNSIKFENLRLHNADFTGTSIAQASWNNLSVSDSRLQFSHMEKLNIKHSELLRCDFTRGSLSISSIIASHIQNSIFLGTTLTLIDIDNSQLVNSDFTNARFVNARITNTTFESCKLEGADFSEADLLAVRFLNTDLSRCTLNGASYDSDTVFPPGTDTSGMIHKEWG